MSSTVIPSSNFQSIFDAALADYLDQTGVDLTRNSFAEKLQNCQSADDILDLLQDKANQFKEYRSGNYDLINCLKPVVQVLHASSGVLGGVASPVSALHLPAVDNLFIPPRLGAIPTNKCHIFWHRYSSRRVYLLYCCFDCILIRIMSTHSGRYCSWDKL